MGHSLCEALCSCPYSHEEPYLQDSSSQCSPYYKITVLQTSTAVLQDTSTALRVSYLTAPNTLGTNIIPKSWILFHDYGSPEALNVLSKVIFATESWETGFELRSVSF